MDTVTLLVSFVATGLLALGMPAHAKAAWKDERWRKRPAAVWKTAGWIAVGLGLVTGVKAHDWGIGIVVWLLALAAAGFAVTLLLTYRPRWLPGALVAAAVAAISSGIVSGA